VLTCWRQRVGHQVAGFPIPGGVGHQVAGFPIPGELVIKSPNFQFQVKLGNRSQGNRRPGGNRHPERSEGSCAQLQSRRSFAALRMTGDLPGRERLRKLVIKPRDFQFQEELVIKLPDFQF